MGRAFEFRKERKMKRWGNMAKQFTRLGKEIAMAVKASGPDPDSNPRLRTAMQNAKGVNMPKDTILAAIKRASSKDEKDYEEIVYEGYGPYGIGILLECATDNPTRTVANVRMYFNRSEGTLGKTGSLDFMFQRKGVFRLVAEGLNMEDLELELIDFGAENIFEEDGEIVIHTAYTDFGAMLKGLEEKNIPVKNAALERIPNSTTELTDEQMIEVHALIDKFEEDDDIQSVYHNMKED
jgi:YebC/PmpR family DNA-binding regulatory protein